MPHPVESTFTLNGHRLAYTTYGEGPRVIVLVHGLLLNQRMHAVLAQALADRGNRAVTLDLLGHGRSDRPPDMWRYSMTTFGQQVIALLDHLDVDEAVVLGTSLGANTALEAAALGPDRLRGMVVEMPVLEHALLGCALAFTPLMVALSAGAPNVRPTSSGVKASAQPSSALSRTGISITSPCTRSGAAAAASSDALAPSDVPPITARSTSRWSSSAIAWRPKIVIE